MESFEKKGLVKIKRRLKHAEDQDHNRSYVSVRMYLGKGGRRTVGARERGLRGRRGKELSDVIDAVSKASKGGADGAGQRGRAGVAERGPWKGTADRPE